MCLRLPGGRYTGALHVSWARPKDASNEALRVIERFRPVLADVCDLFRSAHGAVQRAGVAAHAVMIVTPVYWYQAPSTLKLMIDRLVCADGGNPDPTSTGGKDPAKAKELELRGWPYPRHLKGRAYSVVVHGDAEGAETLRGSLSDWLSDLQLVSAAPVANIGRYVGYYEPYATSHDALDEDTAIHEEVRNAARALMGKVRELRGGKRFDDEQLQDPRPK